MQTIAPVIPAAQPLTRPRRTSDPAAVNPLPALLADACRPGVLGTGAASALAALAQEERVAAGAQVLRRSEAASSLWLVSRGSVALGLRCGPTLQQRRSVDAGEWLDLGSALLHGQYGEDAEAQTDAVLHRLPLPAVLRCAQAHPSVMPALATALAAQVRGLVEGTRGLMTKDVLARCATWLLAQAELQRDAEGRLTGRLQLQVRKRSVAQQLGTTAETFSRTLRHLSRQGLIDVRGYAISLLQVQALQRLAEPDAR
ncbi:Crp/Fnr family transcriptional regulator [Ideonella sp. BN130291]|uniref:Crp/Fnr family transcriptional regulator n=1 Tax=Ideonella sp. BN130291 TaxID=3112940 RepID=UPI002E2657E4|nr:Crp/Fnr family transcriptional regulator [Ideonella sp. BN130291]